MREIYILYNEETIKEKEETEMNTIIIGVFVIVLCVFVMLISIITALIMEIKIQEKLEEIANLLEEEL